MHDTGVPSTRRNEERIPCEDESLTECFRYAAGLFAQSRTTCRITGAPNPDPMGPCVRGVGPPCWLVRGGPVSEIHGHRFMCGSCAREFFFHSEADTSNEAKESSIWRISSN